MEKYYLNYKDNVCIGSSRARLINDEIECREVTKEEYKEYQAQQEGKRQEIEKITQERQELLQWFEYYDQQVMQYNRCVRLGVEFDKDIAELDNQASVNQARLREINEFFKPKVVEEAIEPVEEPSEVVEVKDE